MSTCVCVALGYLVLRDVGRECQMPWVPGAQRLRKRVSEALKLEEQMGVSHCVDAGGSNPGPLEEQSELFTAGPCLQLYCCFRVLHLGAMPRCGFNLPLPEV